MTIQEAIDLALQHHRSGRLGQAEAIYRQVLAVQPKHPDILHLLGVLAGQTGRYELAVELIRQAIATTPGNPDYHCNLGMFLQAQGQLDEAVACYRRALEIKPEHVETLYNLGNIFLNQGEWDQAIACFERALEIKPEYAEAHSNLGNALWKKGQQDKAITCYQRTLEIQPNNLQAYTNLGAAWKEKGDLDEAIACCQRALKIKPDYAEAHVNLGNAQLAKGQPDQAIASYQRAVASKPDYSEAYNNLASAWMDKGQFDQAIICCRQALVHKPNYPEAHNSLGNALWQNGQLDQAIDSFRQALEIKPDYADAYYNLGAVWKDKGNMDQAVACYQQALALKPDYALAHNNLGNVWKGMGQVERAIACYERCVALSPTNAALHSNLVYALHFLEGCDRTALMNEHRRWARQCADPLAKSIAPYANSPDPERRLRIGYVSPDFYSHPVGRFMLSLLARHDHNAVQVFCYAEVPIADETTTKLQAYADTWRNITGLPDEQVAEVIRQDRIDILVDLTLHMAKNRLLVFSRKPAPVQVTFAGYPGSTGLETIDYRLTDPYLDPPDFDDSCYSEKSVRLPDTFWCDDLLDAEPAVNSLPANSNGYVTFGCLNNFCKINDAVLSVWTKVLKANDKSRLLLLAPEGSSRQRVLDRLGIAAERVEFVTKQPRVKYLQFYHRIDVGLDTWPYNGHATSFDSFWMGVPVITLVGKTVVGRAGLSQLTNLGLPELIAHTPDEYMRIAAELAGDLPRLAAMRSVLRQRMKQSPLMDAPRFARNMESAYRRMWRDWCATR